MDRDGFVRTVLEHKDRLHTYAAYLLKDTNEAADVTSEALMRLWTHRDEVTIAQAGSWLHRTLHRLCLDSLRRKAVRPVCDPATLTALTAGEASSSERSVRLSDLRTALARALLALSQRDRAMVVMREIHGMAYKDMSTVLDLPIGTLKAALHRARERLRRELTEAKVYP